MISQSLIKEDIWYYKTQRGSCYVCVKILISKVKLLRATKPDCEGLVIKWMYFRLFRNAVLVCASCTSSNNN